MEVIYGGMNADDLMVYQELLIAIRKGIYYATRKHMASMVLIELRKAEKLAELLCDDAYEEVLNQNNA